VNVGFLGAWRALPIGMAGAIEGVSNAMNSFLLRPVMTPVDASISLAQITQGLTAAAALGAQNGAAGASAAATGAISGLMTANTSLTTAWGLASVVPGGQPAANIAYTEGIKAAAAAAASAVFSSMASLTDMHVCPIPVPIPPHGPGFVTRGSPWVNIGGLSAARQQDQVFEACGGPDPISLGCANVFIGDGANRSFATAEEAALAAMREANPRTTADGAEYGGWVYRNPDGTYTYDPPTRGQPVSVTNMPSAPSNAAVWYHTHPQVAGYDGENFSGARGDKGYSRATGRPGYVATPTGRTMRYDPAADPAHDNTGHTGETTLPATAPP
jgi:uncharacterized Zn-binding protein involved in type VI secretion